VAWTWDETLFAGTAPYYERGRLPYAPGLADAFGRALDLSPSALGRRGGRGQAVRLLDVGCGPGSVTLLLAHLFDEAVGLDADAGMLAEAARLASERGIEGTTWVRMRAEDLPASVGLFRAVVFAASFHWFDRPKVAAAAREMLDPQGAVVHVDSHHQDGPGDEGLPHPPYPAAAIEEVRRAYLGRDRRAGRGVRNISPDDEDGVFRAAGFEGPARVRVPDGRVLTRTLDDVVATVFSMSGTAPHLFGERLPAFESDLRGALLRESPEGLFAVRLPDNELKIWRPATQQGQAECPALHCATAWKGP
jgi:SAM-dependent methyltransferase